MQVPRFATGSRTLASGHLGRPLFEFRVRGDQLPVILILWQLDEATGPVGAYVRRYIFADESGNFDFTKKPDATRYFAVGTVTVDGDQRREDLNQELSAVKYQLANAGQDVLGHFHATVDRQVVRDAVYKVLISNDVRLDVTVLDKRKAQPHIRSTDARFYQHAWWFHFNRIAWGLSNVSELVVVASSLGTRKKSNTFRDTIEDVMQQKCPSTLKRRLLWWRDESDHCLQAADYMLWAVTRDMERNDPRSRALISNQIDSCFEPFANGTTLHY